MIAAAVSDCVVDVAPVSLVAVAVPGSALLSVSEAAVTVELSIAAVEEVRDSVGNVFVGLLARVSLIVSEKLPSEEVPASVIEGEVEAAEDSHVVSDPLM